MPTTEMPFVTGFEVSSLVERWRACLPVGLMTRKSVLLQSGALFNMEAVVRDARGLFGRLSAWYTEETGSTSTGGQSAASTRPVAGVIDEFAEAARRCEDRLVVGLY